MVNMEELNEAWHQNLSGFSRSSNAFSYTENDTTAVLGESSVKTQSFTEISNKQRCSKNAH